MSKYTDTQRLDYFEQHDRDFRYIRNPTMCGTYPAWSYWSMDEGRNETTIRKTLREAIDAALDGGGAAFLSANVNAQKTNDGPPLSPPPCSAWLPISTAPNGLTEILITDGDTAWVDQKIGCYVDDEPGEYEFNGHEAWEEVTHWMPIPSLPNSQPITL